MLSLRKTEKKRKLYPFLNGFHVLSPVPRLSTTPSCGQLTWHDGFLAGGALGGVVVGVALGAEQQVILGSEGLFHQRAAALCTLETLLVPVVILVGQIL